MDGLRNRFRIYTRPKKKLDVGKENDNSLILENQRHHKK